MQTSALNDLYSLLSVVMYQSLFPNEIDKAANYSIQGDKNLRIAVLLNFRTKTKYRSLEKAKT